MTSACPEKRPSGYLSPRSRRGRLPTADEANAYFKERNAAQTAVLLNPKGTIGRLYDARTTPHMFVIGPKGHARLQRGHRRQANHRPWGRAGSRELRRGSAHRGHGRQAGDEADLASVRVQRQVRERRLIRAARQGVSGPRSRRPRWVVGMLALAGGIATK